MADFITVGLFEHGERQVVVTDDARMARLLAELGFEEMAEFGKGIRRFVRPVSLLERAAGQRAPGAEPDRERGTASDAAEALRHLREEGK